MKTFNYYEYSSKRFDRSAQAEQVRNFDYRMALDREYFSGKKVIIFDDVVTSGATAREFANELAECGAQVMGAMFLARTKRMYN